MSQSTTKKAARPPPPVFADPEWIQDRGTIPKRKYTRIKGKRDKKWRRYAPVWQRIEGEWKRVRCKKCKSVSFRVLDTEGLIVHVRCVKEHKGTVLRGYTMERPDDEI